MPCFNPLQATFTLASDGKKIVRFLKSDLFKFGVSPIDAQNLQIPCGQCVGCRLERSRQWAVRAMHEASLYEDNCFLTLTYDDEHLPADLSLVRAAPVNFMKRLRKMYAPKVIRVLYCGEYGDDLGRPHYHLCLFNHEFEDKTFWKKTREFRLYNSEALSKLWPFGFAVIGSLTFESAAYVARYSMKKVTGKFADEFYSGRVPEFGGFSRNPGLGSGWLDKFGESDVFAYDEVVVRGVSCKPPRFYDKRLEALYPDAFLRTKAARIERAMTKVDDNTYDRLLVKEQCFNSKIKSLVRTLDKGLLC